MCLLIVATVGCLSWISEIQERVDNAPALVTTAHLHSPTIKGHRYILLPLRPTQTRKSDGNRVLGLYNILQLHLTFYAHSRATNLLLEIQDTVPCRAVRAASTTYEDTKPYSLPDLGKVSRRATQHGDRHWAQAQRYD